MGNLERYRARLGRVMDDGPPGEKRIAVVMADCGLHTHAEKIARALNQHEGAVSTAAYLIGRLDDALRNVDPEYVGSPLEQDKVRPFLASHGGQ